MNTKEQLRQLLNNTAALEETMRENILSNKDEVFKYVNYKTCMRKYMQLLQKASALLPNGQPPIYVPVLS